MEVTFIIAIDFITLSGVFVTTDVGIPGRLYGAIVLSDLYLLVFLATATGAGGRGRWGCTVSFRV